MLKRYLDWFKQSPDGLLHADDSLFPQIDTVASSVMAKPVTIASSATIAPSTFLTFVSGSVPLATITPPVNGAHLLAFVFTSASPGVTTTTGNIAIATTTVLSKQLLMTFDPITAKYYPSY